MGLVKQILCGFLIAVCAGTSYAQSGYSCEPHLDEIGKEQWSYCSTWAPCKIAFNAINACHNAQKFLERLSSKASSFFGLGKRKQLDAEIVFEALAPEPAGSLQGAWSEHRGKIRELLKDAPQTVHELPEGVHVGSYIDAKREGPGTTFLKSGSTERGQFTAGRLNGHGERVNSNSKYDAAGTYENGALIGQGIFQNASGEAQYLGTFKRNGLTGVATVLYSTGSTYEGEIEGFTPHGFGTFKFADGSTMAGIRVKGRPDGVMSMTDRLGNPSTKEFANGEVVASSRPAPPQPVAEVAAAETDSSQSLQALGKILAAGLSAYAQSQQGKSQQRAAAAANESANRPATPTASYSSSLEPHAANRKKRLDPRTGRDCVTQATGPAHKSPEHENVYFKNTCDDSFSVKIEPKPGDIRGSGIGPNDPGNFYITCRKSDQCTQGKFWFQ